MDNNTGIIIILGLLVVLVIGGGIVMSMENSDGVEDAKFWHDLGFEEGYYKGLNEGKEINLDFLSGLVGANLVDALLEKEGIDFKELNETEVYHFLETLRTGDREAISDAFEELKEKYAKKQEIEK